MRWDDVTSDVLAFELFVWTQLTSGTCWFRGKAQYGTWWTWSPPCHTGGLVESLLLWLEPLQNHYSHYNIHTTTYHYNIFVGYSWPARVDKERLQKLERVAAEFYAQECSAERCSLKRSNLRYVEIIFEPKKDVQRNWGLYEDDLMPALRVSQLFYVMVDNLNQRSPTCTCHAKASRRLRFCTNPTMAWGIRRVYPSFVITCVPRCHQVVQEWSD